MLFCPAWNVAKVQELGIWGGEIITHIVAIPSSSTINCILLGTLLCTLGEHVSNTFPSPQHWPRMCSFLSFKAPSLRQCRSGEEEIQQLVPHAWARPWAKSLQVPISSLDNGSGWSALLEWQDGGLLGRPLWWPEVKRLQTHLRFSFSVGAADLFSLSPHLLWGPQTTQAAKYGCFPYQLFWFLLRAE